MRSPARETFSSRSPTSSLAQRTSPSTRRGHVAVNGEISPPNETQLLPEKKVENTFFHKSVEFPIWGISIPMLGSVGIIAFIEGSLGYRAGVGAGVMRNIVLSGSYSTDPSVQPTFAITGEIFIPAFTLPVPRTGAWE